MRKSGFINISLGPCSQLLNLSVCHLSPSRIPDEAVRVRVRVPVIGLQPTFQDDESLLGEKQRSLYGVWQGAGPFGPSKVEEDSLPPPIPAAGGCVCLQPTPCPGPC